MKNQPLKPSEAETIRRPRGRPRTESDESRRTKILAEARDIFNELGYAGTTMDLVAMRCKISKQTLYQLFDSKTELFMAMIALHRASMVALPRDPTETLPLAETLEKIFIIDMDEDAEADRLGFIHFIVGEAEHFPEIAGLLHKYGVEQSRILLAEWLQLQNDRGRIRIQNTESGARMLLSMVMGALAPLPGNVDNWPSRQARNDHLRCCFDVFLKGVLPRSEGH
ncbi:MAG: TetR/AcrR family transcriptional regulator [Rhizobium sp.]